MPAQFGGSPTRVIVAGKIGRVLLLELTAILDHLRKGIRVNIFDGIVPIERVARSSNWVWACYMNQGPSNSVFNGYDKVMRGVPPGSTITIH